MVSPGNLAVQNGASLSLVDLARVKSGLGFPAPREETQTSGHLLLVAPGCISFSISISVADWDCLYNILPCPSICSVELGVVPPASQA